MISSPKKVLTIFAGGAMFANAGPYANHGPVQATEDELRQHILCDIAPNVLPHIDLELEYIGGSLTGREETLVDWNKLGSIIANSYHDYDGFVILHGDNTISFMASQLAYSFQNLGKSVICADGFVAQEKSRQAIITAVQLAAFSNIPEVSVLSSNHRLLKGVDSMLHDANTPVSFVSRNDRTLVRIGSDMLREEGNIRSRPDGDFIFVPVDPNIEVNVYSPTPISPAPMGYCTQDSVSGLVMQASGAGFIPLGLGGIREALLDLQQRRIPVVTVTDDPHGNIDFNRVAMGPELKTFNVIEGGSMTVPAAVTKLRAAIAMQVPYEEIPEFMRKDMFGETKSLLPRVYVPGDTLPSSSWPVPQQ